jgi:hypothetical protein
VVAAAETSSAPPPPAPAAATEEGQTVVGANAPQVTLEPLAVASPGVVDAVVVLDKDSTPLPVSEGRDAAMALTSEPTSVVSAAEPLPAVEVSKPSRRLRSRVLL